MQVTGYITHYKYSLTAMLSQVKGDEEEDGTLELQQTTIQGQR